MCRASRPHPRMFLDETNDLPLTWRFYLPSQNANLHDNIILVFKHAVDLKVFRLIHNWAYAKELYK